MYQIEVTESPKVKTRIIVCDEVTRDELEERLYAALMDFDSTETEDDDREEAEIERAMVLVGMMLD